MKLVSQGGWRWLQARGQTRARQKITNQGSLVCFFGANLRFQRRMEVTTGRGSDEGRRLANLFQQVAVDCKVSGGLGKKFGGSPFEHILLIQNQGVAAAGDGADGPGWQVDQRW